MTTVIGINWPPFHDVSCSVIVDGKLIFATEEERYTRKKHSPHQVPYYSLISALEFLKDKYDILPGDIDAYATTFNINQFPFHERLNISTFERNLIIASTLNESIENRKAFVPSTKGYFFSGMNNIYSITKFLKFVYAKIGAEFNADIKVYPVMHHLAHASSAYYFSGFKDAVLVVVDGQGERLATTIWDVKNGEFNNILGVDLTGSLGYLYENVCKKLKFSRAEGPGKVMGLAPYGRYNKFIWTKFENVFSASTEKLPYHFNNKFVSRNPDKMYSNMAEYITKGLNIEKEWDPLRIPLYNKAVDLAYALQSVLEKKLIDVAAWAKDNTGRKNISLAGGVALNSKANMAIYYSGFFKNMFVFPAPNDAGATAGAAAYVYEKKFGKKMYRRELKDIYLGKEYDHVDIENIVKKSKFKSEQIGTDMSRVAREISRGSIIGIYTGRAEFGPRALGNRSIVADPRKKINLKNLNIIKGREWWRPLAPSILKSSMYKYLVDPIPNKFMTTMFKTSREAEINVPAVCHVDKTTRPQIVEKRDSSIFYDLIKSFEEITNVGAIINTSFNIRGEPIVETPYEALASFSNSGLDMLYLDGWLLKK